MSGVKMISGVPAGSGRRRMRLPFDGRNKVQVEERSSYGEVRVFAGCSSRDGKGEGNGVQGCAQADRALACLRNSVSATTRNLKPGLCCYWPMVVLHVYRCEVMIEFGIQLHSMLLGRSWCYCGRDRCVNAICMQLYWSGGANSARRVCTAMARAHSTHGSVQN